MRTALENGASRVTLARARTHAHARARTGLHAHTCTRTHRCSLRFAQVTFLCRRHGIVCPEAVDYVNYIRPYDDQFEHPKGGGATVVSVWRKAYSLSTATPPEVWRQGRFLPEGHT
eukprot:5071446-Prymnesium_polylepis.1